MKLILSLVKTAILALFLISCTDSEKSIAKISENQDTLLSQAIVLFEVGTAKVASRVVPCTLSGGTKTTCLSVTVSSLQTEHGVGPWCPRNISDGADKSGIWLDKDKIYNVDGSFIKNLSTFYKDKQWQLYNPETGDVKVTDSKEACLAAARPDVDPKYQNYCVECLPSYVNDESEVTYLIPVEPVVLTKPQSVNPHSGVGLAFNGTRFDAPAPVDAILGSHTLAPFDDCGGHVNPHAGYHYHAVTGCTKEIESTNNHAPMIGYAMDGFMLYSRFNTDGSEPDNLDACRGHEFGDFGYHYHVNDPGKNQIIGCFKAEQGCAINDDSKTCETPWF